MVEVIRGSQLSYNGQIFAELREDGTSWISIQLTRVEAAILCHELGELINEYDYDKTTMLGRMMHTALSLAAMPDLYDD